jgi:flagellar biosynthesis/type III secretory pathway protein FliH
LFLRHLHRARLEQLARRLREWRDLLAQLLHQPRGTELLAALSFYAMATTRAAPERVRDVLHRELDSRTATTMSNPLVRLIRKTKAEGRSEGRAEGRSEGRAEGRAELLLEQLRTRFGRLPKPAVERVQNASADELKAIARAILTARTLAEALDD